MSVCCQVPRKPERIFKFTRLDKGIDDCIEFENIKILKHQSIKCISRNC